MMVGATIKNVSTEGTPLKAHQIYLQNSSILATKD